MSDKQTRRYGNDYYWTYIDDVSELKEYTIWERGLCVDKEMGSPTRMAVANSKYDAKRIVDALLAYKNTTVGLLGKREFVFLDFVKANCPEPYSTMAANAILWNDKDAYNKLRMDFPVIYS
jgi:hypothetical protein